MASQTVLPPGDQLNFAIPKLADDDYSICFFAKNSYDGSSCNPIGTFRMLSASGLSVGSLSVVVKSGCFWHSIYMPWRHFYVPMDKKSVLNSIDEMRSLRLTK